MFVEGGARDDSNISHDDSASNVFPSVQSRVSRKTLGVEGSRCSGKSSTSSVRARLAKCRAKLVAEERIGEETLALQRAKQVVDEQMGRAKQAADEETENLQLKQERLELEVLERELSKLDDRRPVISESVAPPLTVPAFTALASNVSLPTTYVTNVPFQTVPSPTANPSPHPVPPASQPHFVPQSYLQQPHPISVVPSFRNVLPVNEPKSFDGTDCTECRPFLLCFDLMKAQHCSTKAEMFYYSQRYTQGRAHELVLGCHSLDLCRSYDLARVLLDENYGSEFQVANKCLAKLKS